MPNCPAFIKYISQLYKLTAGCHWKRIQRVPSFRGIPHGSGSSLWTPHRHWRSRTVLLLPEPTDLQTASALLDRWGRIRKKHEQDSSEQMSKMLHVSPMMAISTCVCNMNWNTCLCLCLLNNIIIHLFLWHKIRNAVFVIQVYVCVHTHQGLAGGQVGYQPPPCSRYPTDTVLPRPRGQPYTSPRERTRTAAGRQGWQNSLTADRRERDSEKNPYRHDEFSHWSFPFPLAGFIWTITASPQQR